VVRLSQRSGYSLPSLRAVSADADEFHKQAEECRQLAATALEALGLLAARPGHDHLKESSMDTTTLLIIILIILLIGGGGWYGRGRWY
jgi:hypothetical protein